MTTIFDFNPSKAEVENIAFNFLTMHLRLGKMVKEQTKEVYVANIKPDWASFDIAVLFEERGDQEQADKYWVLIPAIAQEYRLGKDYAIVAA
jgi:hypothetical protein